MLPIIRQSRHVWYYPRSALEVIGREAHVLVLRMRETFHWWKFPALCLAHLGNAFTHVCDNCEITSKIWKAAVKIKKKASKCFQQASSCSSLANDARKEAWQLKYYGRQTWPWLTHSHTQWQPSLGIFQLLVASVQHTNISGSSSNVNLIRWISIFC